MNKVILIGRLCNDPDFKTLPNSDKMVCKFTLAVDRRVKKGDKKEADFIKCTAWNKTAELVANYLSKGKKAGISGRIQTSSYEGQDGKKVYTTEVVVDEVEFLDKAQQTAQQPQQGYNGDPDMIPVDDDVIPFN